MGDAWIPFSPEMRKAIVTGDKICTFRFRRYGNPGDTLHSAFYTRSAEGSIAVNLQDQILAPVGMVARHLWRQEGTASPEAFIEALTATQNATRERWGHPAFRYIPLKLGWLHWFGRTHMPDRLIKKIGGEIYRVPAIKGQKALTLPGHVQRQLPG